MSFSQQFLGETAEVVRQTKPEIKLSEAADKATALLQGLQTRLNSQRAENPEDLDRQLREYFVSSEASSEVGVLDQIRERVIDAVADQRSGIMEPPGGNSC